MKTSSKSITEINEPIAILEFELENGYNHLKDTSKGNKIVRCEMNRQGIAEMVNILETIQKHIDGISG